MDSLLNELKQDDASGGDRLEVLRALLNTGLPAPARGAYDDTKNAVDNYRLWLHSCPDDLTPAERDEAWMYWSVTVADADERLALATLRQFHIKMAAAYGWATANAALLEPTLDITARSVSALAILQWVAAYNEARPNAGRGGRGQNTRTRRRRPRGGKGLPPATSSLTPNPLSSTTTTSVGTAPMTPRPAAKASRGKKKPQQA
jgi:hypothetical protein